ncbi:MAG: DUF971 domain-containing protein [Candidatus Acidiferrales bacterium]
MPIPIDPRRKPADIKVQVSSGAGVDVVWSDGHASHYDFVYLRERCPCALCNDERAKKAEFAANPGPQAVAAPPTPAFELPMFKPKAKARAAHAMGNYALQIDFTDGHSTGIYSYDYLRTICPCEDCQREFGPGVA